MFIGEYKHTVDAKNRIFIPAKFRSELGDRFVVTKGYDRCLFVFPYAKWEEFAARIAQLPPVTNRRERLYFFSSASEGTPDSQGRLTVSPLLFKFAGIQKDVSVIGNNDRIEIWADEIRNAQIEDLDPEDISAALMKAGM